MRVLPSMEDKKSQKYAALAQMYTPAMAPAAEFNAIVAQKSAELAKVK